MRRFGARLNNRLIVLFVVVFALASMQAGAGELSPPGKGAIGVIAVAELPAEARNRGVRRIVCGPLPECYYTADHYQTFKRIRESP